MAVTPAKAIFVSAHIRQAREISLPSVDFEVSSIFDCIYSKCAELTVRAEVRGLVSDQVTTANELGKFRKPFIEIA